PATGTVGRAPPCDGPPPGWAPLLAREAAQRLAAAGGEQQDGPRRQALRLGAALSLVDTHAWLRHLRVRDPHLVRLLLEQRVHTSDVVIGELRLGSGLPKSFAQDILALPRLPSPSAAETRAFIERHLPAFAGSGLGWADAQIVLAAAKAGACLRSSDRAVRRTCRALGVPLA